MRYRFGPFLLDDARQELWQAAQLVPLEPQVWRVLWYLLEHRDRVVTKDALLEACWPKTFVSEAAMMRCLSKLRHVLGDNARTPLYIKTLHRQGYRFIAAVTLTEAEPSDAGPVGPPDPQTVSPPEDPPPRADGGATVARRAGSPNAVERRQLTALGCVVGNFLALAERLDPEDLEQVFQAYHTLCTQAAQAFGGVLAPPHGEGVLLYFGYPQAYEDAARRAVFTGLELVQASRALHARVLAQYGIAVDVQLGIHTGMVVMASTEGASSAEPVAFGALPHLTMRLAEGAPPGSLVVSATTWQLVQGYVVGEELGEQLLAGVGTRLQAYRIRQATGARTRLEATSPQQLTPFVGRERERAMLHDALTQVGTGQGQVVLISGEPGIGKSRLLQVVTATVPASLADSWICYCSANHQQTPFYPFIDFLQRWLAFDEAPTPAERLRRVEHLVHTAPLEAQSSVPIVASLLGLTLPETPYPPLQLTALQRRQRTLETLAGLLLARQQPRLLAVEDLHWADPSTLELLDLLVAQGPATPLLMLLTCRSTLACPWPGRSHVTTVTLNRLLPAQVAHMIDVLPGTAALSADVIQHLVAVTDGVPLFVEEVTRWVVTSAAPMAQASSASLRQGHTPLSLPLTLQDTLLARLDQLGAAKETAQLLAILGREGSWPLLLALTPLTEERLRQALQQLVTAEVVYQRGVGAQTTYLFKHALLHEAAYQSMRKRARQHMHHRAAETLVAQFPAIVQAHPEVIAAHYTAAGSAEEALRYWQQASITAEAQAAYREAAMHMQQALEILQHLPETPTRLAQAIDCRLELRRIILPLWELARELAVLREAETLALRLGDPQRSGRVAAALTHCAWLAADLEQALTVAQRAVDLIPVVQDPTFDENIHSSRARIAFSLGQYGHAVAILQQILAQKNIAHLLQGPTLAARQPSVTNLRWLAQSLAELGRFAEGMLAGEHAMQLAEATQQPYYLSNACDGLGYLSLCQGEVPRTIALYRRGLAVCQQWQIAQQWHGHALGLSLAYSLAGQHPEALALLAQILERHALPTLLMSRQPEVPHVAEVYFLAGRYDEALYYVNQQLDFATAHGERGRQAWAYRLRGEIARSGGPHESGRAVSDYQQALALAQELGMRPLQAHCYHGLGVVYRHTGQTADAYAALLQARELYREMAMPLWLPHVERHLVHVRS